MGRDRHHVPDRRDIYAAKLGVDHSALEELTSDAPGITMFHLLTQQLLGWPLYLMFNLTSGSESTQSKKPRRWWQNSHFDPKSPLFSASDFSSVVISDIGIGLTAAALWHLGQIFGSKIVILLYIGPWLWVNHWIGKLMIERRVILNRHY
jgi:omega-6 fatty acid desaturase (delta-12 desaturase)